MKTILLLLLIVLVLGEAPSFAQSCGEGVFLGRLSSNPYSAASTANPYGQYGSAYSATSINNTFGRWGSAYSPNRGPLPIHLSRGDEHCGRDLPLLDQRPVGSNDSRVSPHQVLRLPPRLHAQLSLSLTKRYRAGVAADQAEAAIDAFWNKGEKTDSPEEEPPSDN